MFNVKKQKKGFTTVEILVAVGLVAILMVVAVPRLLGTRQSVGDSAAKQQINTVGVAVNNWFVERDTYTGLTLDKIKARVPEVDIVDSGAPTGKRAGGRALTVSAKFPANGTTAGSTSDYAVLAASNGDNNCWATQYSKAGVLYHFKALAPDACNASAFNVTAPGNEADGWKKFEFPNVD